VGNLAWGATWKDLKDHFRSIGEATRADVVYESNIEGGRSKGYGIIEFKTEDEARAAIDQMTDTEILGRKIFVREDRETMRPQPQQPAWSGQKGQGRWAGQGYSFEKGGMKYAVIPKAPAYPSKGGYGQGGKGKRPGYSETFTKVFVGNLPFSVTWQVLKDHMRQVGDVVHVDIMTDTGEADGKSKGCAAVEFATFGAARRAVQYLHDSMLQGRMIFVREFREDSPGPMGKGKSKSPKFRVSVGNLPVDISWQELKDHMRKVGQVTHVAMTYDGAMVVFGSLEDAQRAVDELNDTKLKGQAITVEMLQSEAEH